MQQQVFSLRDFVPQAVVLANGEWPSEEIVRQWISRTSYVVCCDGAAAKANEARIAPDAIVGDGDSLSEEMKRKYAGILHLEREQETNDLTKAVRYLKSRGVSRISILGATGKREDHALGNISLLVHYLQCGVFAVMPTAYGVFIPCRDSMAFAVGKGRQVSVFNFGATHIKFGNLKYRGYDFDMFWQGTLNEAVADTVEIIATGVYLVYLANRD